MPSLSDVPLSVLDLVPVVTGSTANADLRETVALAQHTEGLGYHRYWVAEHHNLRGVAAAATAVLVSQIAASTERIRVGSGGVMLPIHPPLLVAEQFGTLEVFHPGRIDLGITRAAKAAVAATDGLGIVADGSEVGGTNRPTHHSIFPTVRMLFETFKDKFRGLPWRRAGEKDRR